jgi:RimJ/RimL family protein N-acetyltransferase
MPLDTARLHLRPPVEQDAAAIIAIAGDWEVARRLGRVSHPYTDADVRFFLDYVVPSEPTWASSCRNRVEFGPAYEKYAQKRDGREPFDHRLYHE